MPAEHAAFQSGDGPWYGYWYGVILQVVEGPLVFNPIPGALTSPPPPHIIWKSHNHGLVQLPIAA